MGCGVWVQKEFETKWVALYSYRTVHGLTMIQKLLYMELERADSIYQFTTAPPPQPCPGHIM